MPEQSVVQGSWPDRTWGDDEGIPAVPCASGALGGDSGIGRGVSPGGERMENA